jgi:hypothetical protein
MKLLSRLTMILVVIAFAGAAIAAGPVLTPPPVDDPIPPRVSPVVLHDLIRAVYEDQLVWTRMMSVAVLDGSKARDAYRDRLMDNYEAFEDALTPYYGDGAEKLGTMLEYHFALTEKVVDEVRQGDTFRTVLPYWYANADDIAAYLTQLNPKFWPRKETTLIWRMYLDGILAGAIAHQKGDWRGEVDAHDALVTHCYKMADFMSDGMLKQFPPLK